MKSIIVQKYGGSSLADTDKIKQVAELIKKRQNQGFRLCIVVSAMGKTTNSLIAQADLINKNPPRREMDMLLSCGERVTVALLAMALSDIGVRCISFTGSQSGIITNDAHTGARILEVRPYRVQDELEKDTVVIVAGFQGVSYKKEITTLGRGGSDTTAVALAAALEASACEIYSDVDGVYSADPRVVDNSIQLASLSYEQMEELSVGGAQVLAPAAVAFAKAKNIALFARKTGSSHIGTVIRKDIDYSEKAVVVVTAHQSLLYLQVKIENLSVKLELLKKLQLPLLFSFLGANGDYSLCLGEDYTAPLQILEEHFSEFAMGRIACITCLIPHEEEHLLFLEKIHRHLKTSAIECIHIESTPLSIRVFIDPEFVNDITQSLHFLFNLR